MAYKLILTIEYSGLDRGKLWIWWYSVGLLEYRPSKSLDTTTSVVLDNEDIWCNVRDALEGVKYSSILRLEYTVDGFAGDSNALDEEKYASIDLCACGRVGVFLIAFLGARGMWGRRFGVFNRVFPMVNK